MTRFHPDDAGASSVDAVRPREPESRPTAAPAMVAPRRAGTDFGALARLASDAVLLTVEGRVVAANPAAVRLMNARDPAQLVGAQLAGLIHPDDVPQALPRVARMVSGADPAEPVEHRVVRGTVQANGLDFAIGVRATKPGKHPINGYFRVGYIHAPDEMAMVSLRLIANVNGTE